jgi:DNA-binding beta-propeller fold protein YncE
MASWQPNFSIGRKGLIAVNKVGNQVLFLHPTTFETVHRLDGFPARVHELAISPHGAWAFVPVYGDGRHGANPNPGHEIAVIDLLARRHVDTFSVAPYLAPHGSRWGPAGQLYCVCEDSGTVLELDPATGAICHAMETGSTNSHRIEVLTDGSKLYAENEEDPFVTVLDLRSRTHLRDIPAPNGLIGLGLSPDGRRLVLVDAKRPELLVLDTGTDEVVRRIRLAGCRMAAQIARYSLDGRFLVVTSHDEGLGTTVLHGSGVWAECALP